MACTLRPVAATRATTRRAPMAAAATVRSSAPAALAPPSRAATAALRRAPSARRSAAAARSAVSVQAAKGYKVAVLGAAGGIGQPLSLLLKMQPYVAQVSGEREFAGVRARVAARASIDGGLLRRFPPGIGAPGAPRLVPGLSSL